MSNWQIQLNVSVDLIQIIHSIGFKSCCVQWNKSIRKLLYIPYQSHTWLLGPLKDQQHISVQLLIKTLRFITSMLSNDNVLGRFITNIASHNAQSPIGSNINFEDRLSKNVHTVHCFICYMNSLFCTFLYHVYEINIYI